ncbi:MAG: M48 family metallopeptidase [Nitrosomonas sp.]|nr:M48 family metallopeptidase [Nitrosomonas sp.]
MSFISFEARFFDGETAKPHQVDVELYAACLRIRTTDNSFTKDWLYKEIKVLEQPVPPQPARLTVHRNMDMRLYVEPKYWPVLKSKLPRTAFRKITLSMHWKFLSGYAGLSMVFIFGVVFIGPKLFEQVSGLIPQSVEIQMGKMVLESAISNPVCTAPQGRAALEKIVHNLKQGMARDIPLNVRIVSDDETLNALAAPGGYLVIFSGILKHADTAEEVVGVLAHEMAHIEMNHPMKSLMRNLGVTFMLQMMFGDAGAISNTAQFAGIINQLHYSREDELEADSVGHTLLEKANIDPSGLTVFFERLKQMEAKINGHSNTQWANFSKYFSTHPLIEQRINKLRKNESNSIAYPKALDAAEWQALKNICSESD